MKVFENSMPRDRLRTAAKAFGMLAAVLVVVAVLHSQTSGAPVKSASELIENFKDVPLDEASKLESSRLECMNSLNEKVHAVDDESQLENLPVSEDAVYGFTDEEGNPKEVEWKEGVKSRGSKLNVDMMNQPQKVSEKDENGLFKVLYGDNTVVTADLDRCEVTGLHEPTPSGDIDPRVSEAVDEEETLDDGEEAAEAEEDEPGLSSDIAYGRSPSTTRIFPWTVRVGTPGSRGRPGRGFCSGEIIARYYVVTSRHCTNRIRHNGLEIVAGARLIGSPRNRQIRRSNYIWRHPREDIALVRVSRPFRYTRYVNKVPRFAAYKRTRMLVYASGYGAEKKPGGMSNKFKYASMFVKSDRFCKRHSRRFQAGKEVCCRGGNGNTCGGDSGGPLVFYRYRKFNLLGINSWSHTSCSNKKNVDVFESMVYLRHWVLNTMGRYYGWSNVVLHRTRCYQAKWRRWRRGYRKVRTVRVRC